LAKIAEEQLMADKDPALEKMLKIAKRAIPNSSSIPTTRKEETNLRLTIAYSIILGIPIS
jgi:hypothetical protein